MTTTQFESNYNCECVYLFLDTPISFSVLLDNRDEIPGRYDDTNDEDIFNVPRSSIDFYQQTGDSAGKSVTPVARNLNEHLRQENITIEEVIANKINTNFQQRFPDSISIYKDIAPPTEEPSPRTFSDSPSRYFW